jgi:hypothetical protein
MQIRPSTSVIAALAAIGLNLTPGLAQADYERAMTGPAPTQSRVLAAEIASFRDGASSVRPLSEEISARVDEAHVSSGAWMANMSAHEGRLSAARSEGVILAMTEPNEMVEARLDGMLIAYDIIDVQVRFNPQREPRMITARSLPDPDVLGMLVDEQMGLPSGEAALAGYERMMAAWTDLGPSPALAPIRSPKNELRALQVMEEFPAMEGFLPADLVSLNAEERADRIRELVGENPGLERFVHSAVLEGSDLARARTAETVVRLSPDQLEELGAALEENPRARRFFPDSVLKEVDATRAPDPSP